MQLPLLLLLGPVLAGLKLGSDEQLATTLAEAKTRRARSAGSQAKRPR
jgi:hypothetical protein